jgi:hypothetical protein
MPDDLKRRLELAYRMVHLALSNANPDVQFISMDNRYRGTGPRQKAEKERSRRESR